MKRSSLSTIVRAGTLGFMVGGVVGFATGVLLAPQEGRKTQRRLIYKLDQPCSHSS